MGGTDRDCLAREFLPAGVSMRRLPLGTAYAIWTGIGATGSFLVGIAALGESANVWRIASAALIVLGVCGLRFTSMK
jgi:quaternary ammonium compound-resistance protein SugE